VTLLPTNAWWRQLWVAGLLLAATPSPAATGCSLANPDEDIRGFFPAMTHYAVHYVTFQNQAPGAYPALGVAMGEDLDPVYETIDVPYTLYVVNGDGERLGYVFGANQRGRYSNIQVIAIVDPHRALTEVHIQKIRSPAYQVFQGDEFEGALATIPFSAFPKHGDCFRDGRCEDFPVPDPTNGAQVDDFRAIVRALAKLHVVSELLLKPGGSPVPPSDRARAEWIGSIGGAPSSRKRLVHPELTDVLASSVPDNERVLVWARPDGARLFPTRLLARTPVVHGVIDGEPYTVAWSDTSSTGVVYATDRALQMSHDTLFGSRLLVDPGTGSRVSLLDSETVYGDEVFSLRPAPGVLVLPGSTARRAFPDARVAMDPNPTAPTSIPLRPVGPLALVVSVGNEVAGFSLASGVHNAVIGSTEVVVIGTGDAALAYLRELDGEVLTFKRQTPTSIIDLNTGTSWDALRGEATSGPLIGRRLTAATQWLATEEGARSAYPDAPYVTVPSRTD